MTTKKGVTKVYTLGGEQSLLVVSQSGLFSLISRSNKPAAKRFMRWITDEVVPALLRDGPYSLPSADRADLAAKSALDDTLPEAHRAIPEKRVDAVLRVEALVADGAKLTPAVKEVAAAFAMGERSLWTYRRTT